MVNTNGFMLRTLVHAADISDSEGAAWLVMHHRHAFPRLARIRVDNGYKASFRTWMAEQTPWKVDILEKPSDQKGFAVIPKRWVVERTLAWIGRCRQLSKEYDRNPESTETWMYLASVHLLLRRLSGDG